MFLSLSSSSRLIAASVIWFATLSVTGAKPREPEIRQVLQTCSRLYGPAVDSKRHLFVVNEFYVLALKFNSRGRLLQLDVSPKYFFEEAHREWAEPDNFSFLSESQYKTVLDQIDSIKSRGTLIKGSENISVVTNMTAPHYETYRQAKLEWGELIDLRRGDNAPLMVRWVTVHYLDGT